MNTPRSTEWLKYLVKNGMQKIYKNCLREITEAFISALVKQIYRDTNILSLDDRMKKVRSIFAI